MNYTFTLNRCWKLEKEKDIYILNGSADINDLVITMKDIELDFKTLKETHKELFDDGGSIIPAKKTTALYRAYIKQYTPMNTAYLELTNQVKNENLKYLAEILPYFANEEITDDYIFEADVLLAFEQELITNLPQVYNGKPKSDEVETRKK